MLLYYILYVVVTIYIICCYISAVHRSRRAGAGAGVLTYFAGAGAGAGVCSPPAKLRQHLFVLQTSIIDQRKTNSIEEKAAQYSLTQTYKL